MLHCFVLDHWQDVVLLRHRSYFRQDPFWWVSI
jgi:hypothetical protein